MNTPTPEQNKPTTKARDVTFKALAGVGLAVILVALGWVGIAFAKRVPSALATASAALSDITLFTGSSEKILLAAAPDTVQTEETVSVSFEHLDKDEDGSYTFTYDCKEGLLLEYVSDTKNEFIFCNTGYNFINRDNTLTLRPILDSQYLAETQIAINFIPNGSENVDVTGERTLVVLNDEFKPEDTATSSDPTMLGPEAPEGEVDGVSLVVPEGPQVPPTPTPGNQTVETFNNPETPTTRVSDPNGTADLVVRIIAIGSVDDNGNFTEKDFIDRDDKRSAVKFEVENLGTKETGSWDFEAKLPTRPSYTFKSRSQDSLFPGEKIDYTLGFDRVKSGDTSTIRITIDEDDDIVELEEDNNEIEISVEIRN